MEPNPFIPSPIGQKKGVNKPISEELNLSAEDLSTLAKNKNILDEDESSFIRTFNLLRGKNKSNISSEIKKETKDIKNINKNLLFILFAKNLYK